MKIARSMAVSICLSFSVGTSADVNPAELDLARTYFAMGALATSDTFECFGDSEVARSTSSWTVSERWHLIPVSR